MNQEQTSIGYDEFMPQPLKERLKIFNEVSAENRALLIKTHVERWLAAIVRGSAMSKSPPPRK